MKLIQDIINDLVDSGKSLTSPLLKTKVLATKLKNKELLDWVDGELAGYDDESSLPRYRISLAFLRGTYRNGYEIYNNQPLASSVLPQNLAESMNKALLTMSVESMESFLKEDRTGMLHQPLSAEICNLISEKYREMGNVYFQVLSARKEFSKNSLVQALSEIRSKLLELMLVIDEDYGDTDLNELINQKQKINDLIVQNMSNNIISGDGNILNSGDKNRVIAEIKITKGSIDDLRDELKRNGIKNEDISEIIEIIDEEKPDLKNKKPGKKVSGWMTKMLGKAIDGSWEIGVGAAGQLLADIIARYYGM